MALRLRLLLALGLAALVGLVLADVAIREALRRTLTDQVDRSLQEVRLPLRDGPDPGPDRAGPADPVVAVEVRRADGTVQRQVPAQLRDGRTVLPAFPAVIETPPGAGGGTDPAVYRTIPSASPGGPTFRMKAASQRNGGQLLIAVPFDDAEETLRDVLVVQVVVTVAALAVVVGLGAWFLHLGLRPLRRIEHAADDVAAGHLARVPGTEGPGEVGALARALDTMVQRLRRSSERAEAGEARMRRFVADASHELRTPVAAVSAYAELLERGAAERPDDRSRAVGGIRREASRMGDLVEDLLLLARLDDARPVERRPVELVGVCAEAAEAARAVAADHPVRLAAARPVEVLGDRDGLRRVVDNLLANVRVHTPPGTSTLVEVSTEADRARLVVADDGPGLDDGGRARAFERFWRADAARSRAAGGTGLGLAIVASLVAAHAGTVTVEETPGGGLTVVVELPGLQA